MTEWISVKDETPNIEGEYLTWVIENKIDNYYKIQRFTFEKLRIEEMYIDRWTNWSGELSDDVCYDFITTHWMPLPSPPEEK